MSGTNALLGGGGFHHVALKSANFDATVRFYTEALGFVPALAWTMGNGRRALMLDTGQRNYLEVFEDPDWVRPAGSTLIHFAVRCADCDAAVERVRAAGARITMEPKDVVISSTNGRGGVPVRIAFCEGPSGEVIEFFANEAT